MNEDKGYDDLKTYKDKRVKKDLQTERMMNSSDSNVYGMSLLKEIIGDIYLVSQEIAWNQK
jgi:hypothetical protein